MGELLMNALRALAPPAPPEDPTMPDNPQKVRAWRWKMFVGYWVLAVMIALVVLAVLGWIPIKDGLVHRSELRTLVKDLRSTDDGNAKVTQQILRHLDKQDADLQVVSSSISVIKLASLETSIRQRLQTRCATHDKQFIAELSTTLANLEDEYSSITNGSVYREQTCEELGEE